MDSLGKKKLIFHKSNFLVFVAVGKTQNTCESGPWPVGSRCSLPVLLPSSLKTSVIVQGRWSELSGGTDGMSRACTTRKRVANVSERKSMLNIAPCAGPGRIFLPERGLTPGGEGQRKLSGGHGLWVLAEESLKW